MITSLNNKMIRIRNGKKEVIVKNYITDKYLTHVNLSQIADSDFIMHNGKKNIQICFLKLDEPIEYRDDLTKNDFDLAMRVKNNKTTGNKFGTDRFYNFDSTYSITLAEDIGYGDNIDINQYAGRKITALAFFNLQECLAFVDVSEYSINIIEDQSINILREDEFRTNMECIGIEFPYHLASSDKWYKHVGYNYATMIHARLYSVGYGTQKGKMEVEYKLDNNEIIIDINDKDFSFAIKTGEKYTIYPHSTLYCGSGKYPLARYSERELYTSNSLYPASNKFPLKANVKYLIYKYELCTYDTNQNIIHLNQFYTMNLANDYIGEFKVETKTERRN